MCSLKTMGEILLGFVGLTLVGILAFPQYRQVVYSLSLFLFFLACPLAMFFMMKSMNMPVGESEKTTNQNQKTAADNKS